MSAGAVALGALFRLPDGTTGIVTAIGPGGVSWRNEDGSRKLLPADTIAPHIICEPGNGPICGNDAALADAQARAVRMEAERDAAREQAAALQAALDQAALDLPAAIAAAVEHREAEYRVGINALAGERDEALRRLDKARRQLDETDAAEPLTASVTIGNRTITLTIGATP